MAGKVITVYNVKLSVALHGANVITMLEKRPGRQKLVQILKARL